MKHPDHDISVYIHSDICQDSGHCACPIEEEVIIKGQVVSCRIRGLIGNSWNYRVFINLTQYEIERLADHERFYTLVVTFNHQRVEQRCIDRRDFSTIFVLRPDKNSNPEYIRQKFPDNDTDRTAHFTGPYNWLIEIKVSYGRTAAGHSCFLRSRPDAGVQRTQVSGSSEELLVHFKFIGGPLAKLEPLEVLNLRTQLPQETSMPSTVSIRDLHEVSLSNQLTTDAPLGYLNWDWHLLSPQRTITVQYSDAGLEAASKFAVDPDFVSIVDEQSQDTSLIVSTGTTAIYYPQPRQDLTGLAKRWEETTEGLASCDRDPGLRVNHSIGALNLGLSSLSGKAFDLSGRGRQRLDDRTAGTLAAPRAFSIARRIRDLRARFDQGLSLFKENDRYPWEEDRA